MLTMRSEIGDRLRALLLSVHRFYEVVGHYREPIFARTENELWPYFAPNVIKKFGGYQALGSIGIYVPAFERWWESLLRENLKRADVSDDCLFALFMTNLERFRDPPVVHETECETQLSAWIHKVAATVDLLPNSYSQLESAAYGRPVVEAFPLISFYCHPVKVFAFKKWCVGEGLRVGEAIVVQEPLNRLDPFESIFEVVAGG